MLAHHLVGAERGGGAVVVAFDAAVCTGTGVAAGGRGVATGVFALEHVAVVGLLVAAGGFEIDGAAGGYRDVHFAVGAQIDVAVAVDPSPEVEAADGAELRAEFDRERSVAAPAQIDRS